MDLRPKFTLPAVPFTKTTCIVVVQVMREKEKALIGLMVDGVSETLNLSASDIEDTPDFGEGVGTPSLLGIEQLVQ